MRICPSCGKKYPGHIDACEDDGTALSDAVTLNQEEITASGFSSGQVLGSYRLIEMIGEGGMGCVYLAEHIRLGRKVAIKMLRSEFANNPKAVERFFREARAVNQINHQNIVEITDFIEEKGGYNYYIMELLEGEDLRERLERERVLSPQRAFGIAKQVCGALEAAHAEGFIHRDLKTENIFLIERGGQQDFVKLLDFGIAKLIESKNDSLLDKTGAGSILGTPEYMSPEQATGKEVDLRTDIYSLGIVLYEMVTGKKPFTAKSFAEIIVKQLTVKPTKPSKIKGLPAKLSPQFEKLILQCIETDPKDRPQSVKEVRERIEEISHANSLPLESFISDVLPSSRTVRKRAVLVSALIGIIVLFMTLIPLFGKTDDPALAQKSDMENAEKTGHVAANFNQDKSSLVQVIYESIPQKAEVFIDGNDQPLGTTPLTMTGNRSNKDADITFRKTGYYSAHQRVSFKEDNRILVKLTKEKNRLASQNDPKTQATQLSRKRSKTKKSQSNLRIKSRDTLNPFVE